ncbi:MAG: MBOAT family protein [Bacteroidetes bacterium]|nr:MBOAT family protein [Bacteroidota bacterium]
MLFNSLSFLFLFLPLCLLCYYGSPHRYRNTILLLFSLVFFAWGGVSYTWLLFGSMALNYGGALMIHSAKTTQSRKAFLIGALGLNLCLLVWFKYAGFLAINLNDLISIAGLNTIPVPQIALPIGISFYTFHGISYIVDVYRHVTPVQKSPVRMALYISLFPQLIAGPIVRYSQIAGQLSLRKFSYSLFNKGLQRFLIGLGKKVIVANNLALAADTLWGVEFSDMSCSTAWLGIICYTLQIYTDFSAYSDMAIGLAALFGFEFPENFNLPYTARSMKDFWSRWHISLSSWFRDYVYIPLGGNREGIGKTYRNLLLVFILTGFWHGSSWNFLFWGLFHGVFLMLERGRFGRFLERIPSWLRHAYTLLIILLSWVPFRAPDLHAAFRYYGRLFDFTPFTAHKYNEYIQASLMNRELLLVLFLAVLGSAGFFAFAARKLELMKGIAANSWQLLALAGYLLIFWWSVALILAGSYSPFIYFRF